jgi:hypothetical protein
MVSGSRSVILAELQLADLTALELQQTETPADQGLKH